MEKQTAAHDTTENTTGTTKTHTNKMPIAGDNNDDKTTADIKKDMTQCSEYTQKQTSNQQKTNK